MIEYVYYIPELDRIYIDSWLKGRYVMLLIRDNTYAYPPYEFCLLGKL